VKAAFNKLALRQLSDIYDCLFERNPSAAAAVIERIHAATTALAAYPYMGNITNRLAVRVFPVAQYPYLIFYRIDTIRDEVRIISVRHAARRPLFSNEAAAQFASP